MTFYKVGASPGFLPGKELRPVLERIIGERPPTMEQSDQNNRVDDFNILTGARILILEDQFEVARLLETAITDAGGETLPVSATIDDALALIRGTEKISAAIITMIAEGIYTDAVAHELLRRNVPYVVTTGIGTDDRHPHLHAARAVIKPFQASHVQDVLAHLLLRRSG